MPVVSATTDVGGRRLVLVSELAATPARAWDLWASPRRLERWWGPPGMPMVVEHHELAAGGQVRFHVTAPSGERIDAHWEIASAEPPHALRFSFHTDGLDTATIDVLIEPSAATASVMTITIEFADDAAMQRALAIGFDRGVRVAAERIDEAIA